MYVNTKTTTSYNMFGFQNLNYVVIEFLQREQTHIRDRQKENLYSQFKTEGNLFGRYYWHFFLFLALIIIIFFFFIFSF